MKPTDHDMNRRTFVRTGLGAAGAAALCGTAAAAASQGGGEGLKINGMPAVKLPHTGFVTARLGIGGALWGGFSGMPGQRLSHDQIVEKYREAYEAGVRYYDTSWGYVAPGSTRKDLQAGTAVHGEELIGRAIEKVRDKVYLATKAEGAIAMPNGEREALRTMTREHLEGSLRHLRTDVIDCVKVHVPHTYDATMYIRDALEELRQEGKLRVVGLSNHIFFELTCRLIDTGAFDELLIARGYFPTGERSIVSPRNLQFRELAIAKAAARGMNIIGMKALCSRRFAAVQLYLDGYEGERAAALGEAAIRWALADERFHVYIIGMSYAGDIARNVAIFQGDMTVTNADLDLLAETSARLWGTDYIKKMPEPFKEAEASAANA